LVSYGNGVTTGYFSQDSFGIDSEKDLNDGESILACIENSAPTALIPKVRDMLGAFLFRGDDVYKSLPVLSGGEKSRLTLLRLLLRPVNLLVLDEPTNHLDIHSKDVLLDALRAFTGTIIFVSHDRAFMDALSTKTLELRVPECGSAGSYGPSAARLFYGNYAYYLDRLNAEKDVSAAGSPAAANFTAPASTTAVFSNSGPDSMSPNVSDQDLPEKASTLEPIILIKAGQSRPLSAGEQRERTKQRQTLLRRLEREEGEILAVLEKLEKEKTVLETELAKPEIYSNGEKSKTVKQKIDAITGELETKAAEWEAKAAELEKVRGL
jgi:ATP-binding cassette subfamily F protein 3